MGTWVGAQYGALFFLGKCVGEKTFVFPHLFMGGVLILTTNFLNLCKMGALAGFHAGLYEPEQMESLIESILQYSYFKCLPVLLSQLPAARFWLVVHYLFLASSYLPCFSFAFEMVASCFAELLPARFADRQKFPLNLVVTAPLSVLSLALSMVSSYGLTGDLAGRLHGIIYYSLMVTYYLVISLVVFIILPLSLSKVANLGRYEDLLAFVRHQAKPATASSWPILITMFCVYVAGCLILTVPFHILFTLFEGSYFLPNPSSSFLDVNPSCVMLLILLVFIVLGIVIQCLLYLVDVEKHPCCAPLGQPIAVEDEDEELVSVHHDCAMKQGPSHSGLGLTKE